MGRGGEITEGHPGHRARRPDTEAESLSSRHQTGPLDPRRPMNSPANKALLALVSLVLVSLAALQMWRWASPLIQPAPPQPAGIAIHRGHAMAYVDSVMGWRPGTALVVTNQGKFRGMTEADLLGILYMQAVGKAVKDAGDRVSAGW